MSLRQSICYVWQHSHRGAAKCQRLDKGGVDALDDNVWRGEGLPPLSAANSPQSWLNLVSDAQLGCRRWLLGLLILQSISSVVLDSYQDLLKEHIVVTFFLTMLAR